MKRIFITTNLDRVYGTLYGGDEYADEKAKAEVHFAQLPKEYEYNNNLKVIVLSDDNVALGTETIDPNHDYILYHSSYAPSQEIINSFKDNKGDSHEPNHLHDKVYQIIFNDEKTDTNKAREILEVLGFTDEEVKKKDELEAKLNLLHICLTPDDAKIATLDSLLVSHQTEFTTFQATIKDLSDPFDKPYLEALTTLRDALLK